jgi:hypothetical protein
MLFFQGALLGGYGLAYSITLPFPFRTQVKTQIALLLIGLALLPITPLETWKPDAGDDPNWRIIALLAASVGLPYVVLAMTSPLLSTWLARIDPGLQPARFFAASNLGSFIGLLSYPFVFERTLSSGAQTLVWSWAFAAYAVLFFACGLITMARAKGEELANAGALLRAARGVDPVLCWISYAALGSILLLAVTNAITQFSGVAPFLWVAPLSLYLLSFVIVFGRAKLYRRAPFAIAFLLLSGASFVLAQPVSSADLALQLGLNLVVLFTGCIICQNSILRCLSVARLAGFLWRLRRRWRLPIISSISSFCCPLAGFASGFCGGSRIGWGLRALSPASAFCLESASMFMRKRALSRRLSNAFVISTACCAWCGTSRAIQLTPAS